MTSVINEKKEKLILYVIALIGSCVYISLVFNRNVWLDEAFTATLVRTDMAGVIERSMNDTLPPLYNIVLKITTDIFGYTVPVMKLTSVLPMILTIILGVTTVRKRHGFKTAAIFTACMFTMPNLLFFGVEIRMYSLGFFFATASAVFAYECIKESSRKNWIIFTVVSVLSGYSHHFAFVAVGFVYLYVLLWYLLFERDHVKRFFLCLAATFVLYFPCLIVTLQQIKSVSGYFSMPDVTFPVFIKDCIYPFITGNKVTSVLLALCVLILFAKLIVDIAKSIKGNGKKTKPETEAGFKINPEQFYAAYLFAAYYGVLVFGTVVSKLMTANIFVDRYLLFAHGFIWLFFAISLKESPKTVMYVCIAAVIGAGIFGYVKQFDMEYSNSPDEVIAFLEQNVKDGDVLYTIEDNEELAYCLPFYEEKLINYEDINKAVDAADIYKGDIWIAVIDYADNDVSTLSRPGYDITSVGEFDFDRYHFNMYKMSNN